MGTKKPTAPKNLAALLRALAKLEKDTREGMERTLQKGNHLMERDVFEASMRGELRGLAAARELVKAMGGVP